MPYIKQNKRAKLDWIAANLAAELGTIGVDGNFNYFICKTFMQLQKLGFIKSYKTIKDFKSELTEARDEISRRVLAPYEDKKIKENGDVFE